MWRERIIATRKAKGITIQTMSDNSDPHLTPETITRVLSSKTESPRVDTVLNVGRTVGLEPWEIFADDALIVAYQGFLTLQAEFESVKAERDALLSEVETLREGITTASSTVNALNYENDRLRLTITHNEKTMALQEEIIALLKREK
jgi:lambda repressor-like predicted transcriptional regulator